LFHLAWEFDCTHVNDQHTKFGMLSLYECNQLPGEAKQNNLPPECGQPIDAGGCIFVILVTYTFVS
jgi:hypothetical protein